MTPFLAGLVVGSLLTVVLLFVLIGLYVTEEAR